MPDDPNYYRIINITTKPLAVPSKEKGTSKETAPSFEVSTGTVSASEFNQYEFEKFRKEGKIAVERVEPICTVI